MSETPTAPEAAAAPAKKKRGKLVPLLILVLLLGGGGGGAYWYFVARAAAAGAEAAPEHEEEVEPTGVVTFEPFVVNLADPGGSRFLRVSLSLVVKTEEEATEVGENAVVKSRIRSALIELLAQKTSETLVTPEGKTELKKEIREQVAHIAHEAEVSDVLFSEFVVQF